LSVILIPLVVCILAMVFDTRAGAQSRTATDTHEPGEVVFVCEHGSVKSLVAMEHFNRKARERGLPYHAVARGIVPERAVPEAVQAGLRTDGFETSDFLPQSLTASDVDHAVLVVSFDQDITKVVAGKARHLAWDNLPGVLADYPRGRAAIVKRVDSLVDELASGNSP
jgi:protein-tyrosine-phosphatase